MAADLENLYDSLATHKIREKVLLVVNKAKATQQGVLPSIDQQCNLIGRVFKMGDKLMHIIRAGSFKSSTAAEGNETKTVDPQKVWFKARFNLMLNQNLLREIGHFPPELLPTDVFKMIREVSNQTLKEIQVLENTDNLPSNYYLNTIHDGKNLVSSVHQSSFVCAKIRSQIKRFHIEVCQHSLEYEPIKEIYKKSIKSITFQLQAGKTSLTVCSAESQQLFALSLAKLLEILSMAVNNTFIKHRSLYSEMKQL